MNQINNDKIRHAVREQYAKVAQFRQWQWF
jgi:bacterioferritin-associated ferredoxin